MPARLCACPCHEEPRRAPRLLRIEKLESRTLLAASGLPGNWHLSAPSAESGSDWSNDFGWFERVTDGSNKQTPSSVRSCLRSKGGQPWPKQSAPL